MCNLLLSIVLVLYGFLFQPMNLWADEGKDNQNQRGLQAGWSTFSRGGAVYQFDSDLEGGGSYKATRLNIQAGRGYGWNRRTSVSLGLSYRNDGYSFSNSGGGGISGLDPWDTVHSVSISAPTRLGMSDKWSGFFIPAIRSRAESGAEFNDTVTGGALAFAAYRFGARLTLGPGIGVVTQLEDSVSIFPVVIINWKITDRISLETGRGLAATLGPGLSLNYRPSQQWNFAIGGRYEKLRFRLDKNGNIPNGIGEDNAIPLFVNGTYRINPRATLSLVGGVELDGELLVEDAAGNLIAKESVDPALFGGMTFNLRL